MSGMEQIAMVQEANDFVSIKEASKWASEYLGKHVTTSNISYLIQYGRIEKHESKGNTVISLNELSQYYKRYTGSRKEEWRQQLGHELNWSLSFDQYKESETTKHVHRLHPYKGKFIPQLVEYFLDDHTDDFKKSVYFNRGDIILDPFVGSGTTLVQSNELGIHAIGIDISSFNVMISGCKTRKYNIDIVENEVKRINEKLNEFLACSKTDEFEKILLKELSDFNTKYFPVPEYKYKVRIGEVDEKKYGSAKEIEFLPIYNSLVEKYGIKLAHENPRSFMDTWFIQQIRNEIDFVRNEISKIRDTSTRKLLAVTLSRTIRSCRATTHADLATLNKPITTTYYCRKHGKICKPLFSIKKWWNTYSKDTIKRIAQFDMLRTDTKQVCITGDSKSINIIDQVRTIDPDFANLIMHKRINGIFSSPPYVGLIDYHEQHAYAYDTFGFARNDDLEIGPMFKGQGPEARQSYIEGISDVLLNCKKYLIDGYSVFLVANDKYNIYPAIAERAGMVIVDKFLRPVLNRTEKDKGAYSEIIFHLKEKN